MPPWKVWLRVGSAMVMSNPNADGRWMCAVALFLFHVFHPCTPYTRPHNRQEQNEPSDQITRCPCVIVCLELQRRGSRDGRAEGCAPFQETLAAAGASLRWGQPWAKKPCRARRATEPASVNWPTPYRQNAEVKRIPKHY